MIRSTLRILVVCWLALGPVWGPAQADAAEAERQYRVGRRLAAERSPEAVTSLRRVIELDPAGALADDARVELARYFGAPDWPEQLGSIRAADLGTTRALLDAALEIPGADRAAEARYYRGLLLLEPYPGRSESVARLELVALATRPDSVEWSGRARYATAVLAERNGDAEAARAAFLRVIVDAPDSPAAVRARVGVARVDLAGGHAGRAAEWAQEAIALGVPEQLGAVAVREAALRMLVEPGGVPYPGNGLRLLGPGTGVRAATRMIPTPDDGVLIGDRRSGSVLHLDAAGRVVARWAVAGLSAIAASPGAMSVFAATANELLALAPDGTGRPIADLGEFASPTAIVADGMGRFWVLDRKGQRVGRVDPEQSRVVPLAGPFDLRLSTLIWDRGRMIGLDSRSGAVVAISATGQPTRVAAFTDGKALDVAVGPSGILGVLDARTGALVLLGPAGTQLGIRPLKSLGPLKPVGVAFGPDGALHVFDGSNAAWWRSP